MANVNFNKLSDHTFDAIVIGSGISGGWAAKELCDHGLKICIALQWIIQINE